MKAQRGLVQWMANARILKGLRRLLGETFVKAIAKNYGIVVYYSNEDQKRVMEQIRNIRKGNSLVMTDNEAYQLITLCRAVAKIDGDIAEVGVYKGASAKLLCDNKAEKSLHLFDTFEGLPEIGKFDNPQKFESGGFMCTAEKVREFVGESEDVFFYKGVFPNTVAPVESKCFSFVHLDVDLYQGTKDALTFFCPRMSPGGLILIHDYTYAEGVRKAVDDFFADKRNPVLELSGTQCLIPF